ncbi:MAG: hypothetical protein DRJ50_00620 [Actinobacteria bacterium]|nr:MAG: hypothetical protein DRJ50_00620 [Actinomycetota bacterium]
MLKHPRSVLRRGAALTTLMLVSAACASSDDAEPPSQSAVVSDPTQVTDPEATAPAETASPDTAELDSTTSESSTSTSEVTAPTATGGPLPEPQIQLHEVGQFDQPVNITSRPLDGRIFVVEQPGRIIAFDDLSTETVLDITGLTEASGERGLLGLAFHPDFDLAYVNYTNDSGNTVVAEFEIDPDSAVFDLASFREVFSVIQPFANHNGGNLAFGPDGHLYIGLGDGGGAGDPNRFALDLSNPFGKIHRINPLADGDLPYTVPPDNPFVGEVGETIWSFGLRNPWRFSFDPVTGDLWIADVGQNELEEINVASAIDGLNAGSGVNFGWSALEGTDPFNEDQSTVGAHAPIYEYRHGDGRCSVSGGVRYRGETIRDLAGWYVFGDFCTGEIWALDPTASAENPRVVEIGELAGLSSIAQGPERELYAVSNAGTVARFSIAD